MSRLAQNVIANFGGQAAATVIAFVTVPFYMRYLGPEGFGLAGFLLTFQALAAILDFGLSTTVNREISRIRTKEGNLRETRDLVRSLEVFYAAVALAIFAAGAFAAPWFAANWFQTGLLDSATLRLCLTLGAASVALRWPTSLYQGTLRGLEQQVEMNALNAVAGLLRGVGTVAALAFVSRSVVDFFWWQVLFSLGELSLFALGTWRHLRQTDGLPPARFRVAVLRQLWGYSVQVGGLSLFALILKQLDKVLISRLLPIEQLGFYNAASLASGGLGKVVQPVQAAVFPRLSGLHAQQNHSEMARLFHQSCTTTAFLVCPCVCVLLFFSADVLLLWTGDATLAREAGPTLTVLAAAMLFNCQMNVIFALQLAAGMAWLPLLANALGAAILGPALFFLVQRHGLVGAAYAWLAFNLLNAIIVPPLTLRRLMPGEYWRWLVQDTFPFVIAALICFGLVRWATMDASLPWKALLLAAASLAYVALAALGSPGTRLFIRRLLSLKAA